LAGAGAASGREAAPRRAGNGPLAAPNIPGADAVRDGDKVRIRITNANLFDPGKATLKPGAAQVLDRVAAAVRRDYSGHQIGIEGHTDADPIRKSNWRDNHELSVQRALAVYDYLTQRAGVASDQVYVAGYGPNMPLASNKSSGGKAQNRRVELVIEPNGARGSTDRSRRE
jgi:chemotaxis protein MotB